MERFEREAKLLASLNHPNIAAIYGLEDRAIVMELVEGQTLKGPIPLETAVRYAGQIADALEAAHEKGIVHRDLKPANIKVTRDGVVKLLDFGLAKATEDTCDSADPDTSPTVVTSQTHAGVLLGTAAYMSPEQARGAAVDKRADIWAFGCVLYEMLTGNPAFQGETTSDILGGGIARGAGLEQDSRKRAASFAPVPGERPEAQAARHRRCDGAARDRSGTHPDAVSAMAFDRGGPSNCAHNHRSIGLVACHAGDRTSAGKNERRAHAGAGAV